MTVRDRLSFPERGEKLQRRCQCSLAVKLSLHGDGVSIFESTKPFLELHANKWQRHQPSTFLAHLPIRRVVFLSVEML